MVSDWKRIDAHKKCQPDNENAIQQTKQNDGNGTATIYMDIIRDLVKQLDEARKETAELKERLNLQVQQGATTKMRGETSNNRNLVKKTYALVAKENLKGEEEKKRNYCKLQFNKSRNLENIQSKRICWYHLHNKCRFGDKCRHDHGSNIVKPKSIFPKVDYTEVRKLHSEITATAAEGDEAIKENGDFKDDDTSTIDESQRCSFEEEKNVTKSQKRKARRKGCARKYKSESESKTGSEQEESGDDEEICDEDIEKEKAKALDDEEIRLSDKLYKNEDIEKEEADDVVDDEVFNYEMFERRFVPKRYRNYIKERKEGGCNES